jgi:hypothetical protein
MMGSASGWRLHDEYAPFDPPVSISLHQECLALDLRGDALGVYDCGGDKPAASGDNVPTRNLWKQLVNRRFKRTGARGLVGHVGPLVDLLARADTPEWDHLGNAA